MTTTTRTTTADLCDVCPGCPDLLTQLAPPTCECPDLHPGRYEVDDEDEYEVDEPQAVLDWNDDSEHWAHARRPCLWCSAPTNLRDAAGRPSHKVCAEHAIDHAREAAS